MPHLIVLCLLVLFPVIGSADDALTYNRIGFSVTVEQAVSNDRMVIIMTTQAKGSDLPKLANKVNETMDWALKIANRETAIEAQTLNYQTSPVYAKGSQQGWQVSQSLSLAGSDIDILSELMGKLQSRLQTQSVEYRVSAERQSEVHEKLTSAVLQKFAQRAQTITASMNRSTYQIVEIAISNDGQYQPQPMLGQSRMLMAEGVAAPSFQAGSQTIRVTASGVIELSTP